MRTRQHFMYFIETTAEASEPMNPKLTNSSLGSWWIGVIGYGLRLLKQLELRSQASFGSRYCAGWVASCFCT